jgi:hypothetical protein
MPDHLLMYYIENPLMIISINSWNFLAGGVMVVRLVIDFGELVNVTLNGGAGKRVG